MIGLSFTKLLTQMLLVTATMGCTKPAQDAATPAVIISPALSTDTTLRRYLALGDSYTIGEAVDSDARYPVIAATKLLAEGINPGQPEIIARTGWTTNDLQAAIAATKFDQTYDVVTLLIGVNNQYQGGAISVYREQFETLVKKAISLAGDKPQRVVVLSIPDYSVTPFGQRFNPNETALAIDGFNKVNLEVSTKLNVRYLDITPESRKALNDPSMVAVDNLHFSGKMYQIWADKLTPLIRAALESR